MKVKVRVTAEDIASGVRGLACLCPVALAVKRATGTEYVSVGVLSIQIGELEILRGIGRALKFARSFDLGEAVGPFTFTLDIPEG